MSARAAARGARGTGKRPRTARTDADADAEAADALDAGAVFGRGREDDADARRSVDRAARRRNDDGGGEAPDVGFARERVPARRGSAPRTVDPATFAKVLEGFYDGDVESILRECRDERNVGWSEGEIEEAMRALREDGKTINAPFCFAPGAIRLKQSLHAREWRAFRAGRDGDDATITSYEETDVAGRWIWRPRSVGDDWGMFVGPRRGLATGVDIGSGECEVGVYVSVAGGDIAEWHRDVGQNGTIQLTGSKVWEVEEYGDNAELPRGFIRNASLTDEPKCGADYYAQPRGWPRSEHASAFGNSSVIYKHRIDPGQTICLNKGVFHRVTPVGRDVSVSVDIRVTKPEMAEWMAESVYLQSLCHHRSAMVVPDALMPIAPIRWMPFESEFSDGLVIGARLKFIVSSAKNFRGMYDDSSTYRSRLRWSVCDEYGEPGQRSSLKIDVEPCGLLFNPTCTCSVITTGEYYVLNVKATSALTGKDLMSEFNIYIDHDEVQNEADMQIFESPITFARFETEGEFDDNLKRTRKFIRYSDYEKVRKLGISLPLPKGTLIISDIIASLRCVLLDANILMFDDAQRSLAAFWDGAGSGKEGCPARRPALSTRATHVPTGEVRDRGHLYWDGQNGRRFFAS